MTSNTSLTDHFFRTVIDNAAIAGFDGYFKEISKSWQESLGWSIETLLSKPLIEFVHPDDRQGVLEHRARLRDGEGIVELQNRYCCKGGGHRWFEWRATADVERELVFAVARDITKQKEQESLLEDAGRAQEELRRRLVLADRMATVGTLAAGMAHEINSPLASMTCNLPLLRSQIASLEKILPEDARRELDELVEDLVEGAARIDQIVTELRRFSAASTGRIELLLLPRLVQRVVRLSRAEIAERARLVEEYAETPPVNGDEAELNQVVLNLIVNAIQAIAPGEAEANEIRIQTREDERGWAVFEITDSGDGISEDVQERVFEPFFTTKPTDQGTGMGLSICHAVITRLGGHIELESNPGEGTRVCVTLPPVGDVSEAR